MWVVLWPKVCATLRPPHLPFCSLPGNILFPAWEHFVPWAGIKIGLDVAVRQFPLVTSSSWLFVASFCGSVSKAE